MPQPTLPKLLLGSLVLLASPALATAGAPASDTPASGGSCSAPANEPTPPADASLNLPDYAPDADEETTLQAEAEARNAWQNYLDEVSESLARSSDARDWALAVALAVASDPLRLAPDAAHGPRAPALLERAAAAAPDDVLVQWIAARSATDSRAAVAHAAAERLKHLEPENAAVYLDDLGMASKSRNVAEVDRLLATMSTGSRFDVHFAAVLKNLTDAFAHVPAPPIVTELQQGRASLAVPFASAMGAAAAIGFPPLQHLLNECRAPTADAFARAADCAAIARLMIHGDTLISNRLGYAILRVSHTHTADDEAAARLDDWVYSRYMKLLGDHTGDDPEDVALFERAWAASGSEIEVMRFVAAARGFAATPPDDWQDDRSPFSAKSFALDAAWLKEHPAAQ